jgi:hypothetical protein
MTLIPVAVASGIGYTHSRHKSIDIGDKGIDTKPAKANAK